MDQSAAGPILILEDELLIALDHEHQVQEAGFSDCTFMHTCSSALEWLQVNTPLVALLDIRLRDGPCSKIATLLNERGIPFIVCSGSVRDDVDPAFLHGIWIKKPCIPEDLISALKQARAKVAKPA